MTLSELTTEVASILGVEAGLLGLDSSPNTLPEWDSIAELGIISLLDRVTGEPVQAEDVASVSSFGAIVELVRARGKLDG